MKKLAEKKTTPDERFLIKLYEVALQMQDPSEEIDSLEIAKAVSLKETALKNIIKHLAQANFIEKGAGSQIYLTENGQRFVKDYFDR